jgi:hypothetical protein
MDYFKFLYGHPRKDFYAVKKLRPQQDKEIRRPSNWPQRIHDVQNHPANEYLITLLHYGFSR